MGKSNILVVDDLRSMRLTLGGLLEDEGHEVVTVENGYQAIEVVRETHFDAIFMDIKMPGIDGVQTFREIKKIAPEVAVIMMTAYSVEDLIEEALKEGAYAVVYKPFDINRIVAIIEEILGGRTLILVVDAQSGDREMLKSILEGRGYRVATARDGAEAIEMVRSRHYDVIFLDARLPAMDGVETFVQVKKIDSEAVVILMTEFAGDELVARAVSNGAYAGICKPFDTEQVLSLVENISGEKKK